MQGRGEEEEGEEGPRQGEGWEEWRWAGGGARGGQPVGRSEGGGSGSEGSGNSEAEDGCRQAARHMSRRNCDKVG